MMLGSYSYLDGNERRFSYTTTTDTKGRDKTHHFALMPLDEDLAVVRFFTDERFVEPKPVPPEFTLTGGPEGGKRRAFEGCFFLNWTCSYYKLRYAGALVLHMSQQRRHAISVQNGAVILSGP